MRIPYGYGTEYRDLDEVERWLKIHHHPEYVRRLVAWLKFKKGTIGVGNGWRRTQPVKPGAAPEGKSFHQDQRFNDGFVGAAAVDLVAPDGPDLNHSHDTVKWSMVPAEGTKDSFTWGLHCNVDKTEPWHMQPIELDGWATWTKKGRPAPRRNYPIPGSTVPLPPPSNLITDAPPATPFPLKRGGRADPNRTRWLQQIMNERWGAGLAVDGSYGLGTENAVKGMQRKLSITVDGVYGAQTAFALSVFLTKAK